MNQNEKGKKHDGTKSQKPMKQKPRQTKSLLHNAYEAWHVRKCYSFPHIYLTLQIFHMISNASTVHEQLSTNQFLYITDIIRN